MFKSALYELIIVMGDFQYQLKINIHLDFTLSVLYFYDTVGNVAQSYNLM